MLSKGWPQKKDAEEIFQKQEKIGSGSFGSVYKGINKHTNEPVSVQIIDYETADDAVGDIKEEMYHVSLVDPGIVSRHQGAYEKDNKLWIIMDYLAGTLLDLMKMGPLDENCIAVVLRELLQVLKELHQEGRTHGDIKPANIFFNANGEVRFIDCGVPQRMMMRRRNVTGAPYCMAPEVIKQTVYDYKADIWSTGILSIFMAKNELPYSELHYMRALFLIPKNPPPLLEGSFTKTFKEFVSLCLKKDPAERCSAKDLLDHPFIKSASKSSSLIVKQRLPLSPSVSRHQLIQKASVPPLRPLHSVPVFKSSSSSSNLTTPSTSTTTTTTSSSASSSSSSSSSSPQKSSALTLVIYPVLSKLLKANQDESTVMSMLTQLKIAFDTVEHARPGITHTIIAQIIQALKR